MAGLHFPVAGAYLLGMGLKERIAYYTERRQLVTILVAAVLPILLIVALFWLQRFGSAAMSSRFASVSKKAQPPVKQDASEAKTASSESQGKRADGPKAGGGRGAERGRGTGGGAVSGGASQAMHEAMVAPTPEVGITKLETFLAQMENLDEASLVYCTLGTLYAQSGADGMYKAEAALTEARRMAQTEDDRDAAALGLVRLLDQQGETDRASEEAKNALAGDMAVSLAGLELTVLLGRLEEKRKNVAQAEWAYEKAMTDAAGAAAVFGEPAWNVYRQACLALVQFYRAAGREEDAEAVRRKMKAELDGIKER